MTKRKALTIALAGPLLCLFAASFTASQSSTWKHSTARGEWPSYAGGNNPFLALPADQRDSLEKRQHDDCRRKQQPRL